MNCKVAKCVLLFVGLLGVQTLSAQQTAPAPNRAWHSKGELNVSKELVVEPQPSWDIDPGKFYTLPELVDLAEQHNPDTRASWQQAKLRAAELGIARAAYFP